MNKKLITALSILSVFSLSAFGQDAEAKKDAAKVKLVFVRIVDDAEQPRGGGTMHDFVVAIMMGEKPMVVGFGGD